LATVAVLAVATPATGTAGATNTTAEPAVDVVFVLDDTNSMNPEIDGLKQNVIGYADSLEERGIDARYALVTFRNDYELDQGFTDDAADVERTLSNVEAAGGGDIREDSFDAIRFATSLDYRADATRVIVTVTDAPSHTSGTVENAGTPDGQLTDLTLTETADLLGDEYTLVSVSPDLADNPELDACSRATVEDCGDLKLLTEEAPSGSWIDLAAVEQQGGAAFDGILEEVADTTVRAAGGGGQDWEVRDVSANRSGLETGESVRLTATVENLDSTDTYEATFAADNERIATRSAEVSADEAHTFSVVTTFDEQGWYRLSFNGDEFAKVYVDYREKTTVDVTGGESPDTVVATVENDHDETPTTIPLSAASGNDSGVAFENITVELAEDASYTLRATRRTDTGADAPPVPNHTRVMSSLSIRDGPADDTVESARIEFAVSNETLGPRNPSDLVVYRRQENASNGTWEPVDVTLVDRGDGYRFRANTSAFSTFVVGVRQPSFDVTNASLSRTSVAAGESVGVSAIVRNVGEATGTHRARIVVGGEAVTTRRVELAPGESARVFFEPTVDATGTHTVSLSNETVGRLSVAAPETPTGTPTLESLSDSTRTTAVETTAPATTAQPTSGGGPGFGVVAVLVALALAVLGLRRET
jgi:PGF-CTERM protein